MHLSPRFSLADDRRGVGHAPHTSRFGTPSRQLVPARLASLRTSVSTREKAIAHSTQSPTGARDSEPHTVSVSVSNALSNECGGQLLGPLGAFRCVIEPTSPSVRCQISSPATVFLLCVLVASDFFSLLRQRKQKSRRTSSKASWNGKLLDRPFDPPGPAYFFSCLSVLSLPLSLLLSH